MSTLQWHKGVDRINSVPCRIRPVYFHAVRLGSSNAHHAAKFLSRNPAVAAYIKRLTVVLLHQDFLPDILSACVNLDSLHISDFCGKKDHFAILSGTHIRVRSLTVTFDFFLGCCHRFILRVGASIIIRTFLRLMGELGLRALGAILLGVAYLCRAIKRPF